MDSCAGVECRWSFSAAELPNYCPQKCCDLVIYSYYGYQIIEPGAPIVETLQGRWSPPRRTDFCLERWGCVLQFSFEREVHSRQLFWGYGFIAKEQTQDDEVLRCKGNKTFSSLCTYLDHSNLAWSSVPEGRWPVSLGNLPQSFAWRSMSSPLGMSLLSQLKIKPGWDAFWGCLFAACWPFHFYCLLRQRRFR